MLLQQMLTGIVFISWRLFCLVSSKRCNIIQFSEKKNTCIRKVGRRHSRRKKVCG